MPFKNKAAEAPGDAGGFYLYKDYRNNINMALKRKD